MLASRASGARFSFSFTCTRVPTCVGAVNPARASDFRNETVTAWFPVIDTEQASFAPALAHAPPHRTRAKPFAGVALSVTAVPASHVETQ